MVLKKAKVGLGDRDPRTISLMLEFGWTFWVHGYLDEALSVVSEAVDKSQLLGDEDVLHLAMERLCMIVESRSNTLEKYKRAQENLEKFQSSLSRLAHEAEECQEQRRQTVREARILVGQAQQRHSSNRRFWDEFLQVALEFQMKGDEALLIARNILQKQS
ncbi:hypothetical protein ACJZ2D_002505 [Fusarium nematophilum]